MALVLNCHRLQMMEQSREGGKGSKTEQRSVSPGGEGQQGLARCSKEMSSQCSKDKEQQTGESHVF